MDFTCRHIVAILLMLILVQNGAAQSIQDNDSLIAHLKRIRSTGDSAELRIVYQHISNASDQHLIKPEVWTEIRNLQKVLSDKDYNDLLLAFQSRLLAINSTVSLERALEIGKGSVDIILKAKTEYQYFTALWMFREMRIAFRNLGKLNESIKFYGEAEKAFLKNNDSNGVSIANNVLSGSYFRLGMQERAIYHQGKSIGYLNERKMENNHRLVGSILGVVGKLNRYAVLASFYLDARKLAEADSCIHKAMHYYRQLDSPLLHQDVPYLFLQKAISKALAGNAGSQLAFDSSYQYLKIYNSPPHAIAVYNQERASDLIRKGNLDAATYYLQQAHQVIDSFKLGVIYSWGEIIPGYYEAQIALARGQYGEATRLLRLQIEKLEQLNLRTIKVRTLELLAKAYEDQGNYPDAYKALLQAFELRNGVIQDEKDTRTLTFETERKIAENETAIMMLNAREEANKKTTIYLFGIIALLGLLAIALFFFYRNKQRTGRELQSKNQSLEEALNQLKAAQSQLIQSEKMASLGELTAGIAHEIQNPLNFVNNFSEVSRELIEEVKSERSKVKSERDEGLEEELLEDISQNLEKINHHGKRADAIVKGMLAHSRNSSGKKEPTDLNALAEEYLRLSYNGFKAKDASFYATFQFEADENLPKVNVVPQDIGRVLLNLMNNAFYAAPQPLTGGYSDPNYKHVPTVWVSTKRDGDKVLINVSDNGPGIPESIREKIFQPFFTTKPTGEGTGLGLSLSYDIVKAHGGELKVDTKEGEGSTFIIQLLTI